MFNITKLSEDYILFTTLLIWENFVVNVAGCSGLLWQEKPHKFFLLRSTPLPLNDGPGTEGKGTAGGG